MIKTRISILQTSKYTQQERENMSRDEQLSIERFGFEKIVNEKKLISLNFTDMDQLRHKMIELCEENDPYPIVLLIENSSLKKTFVVGKKYKEKDPNAIFEIMLYKIENKTSHIKYTDIKPSERSGENIIEIARLIGKNIHKLSHYVKDYAVLHELTEPLYGDSNLITTTTSTWGST